MTRLIRLLPALAVLFLVACGRNEPFPPYDCTADVAAHYKKRADFFEFKTPADLPSGLEWKNGGDLPEIGDPRAKKGGTLHTFTTSFPSTFRFVGPDASSDFRTEHWDYIYMSIVLRHPNVDGWVPGVASEWAVSADKATIFLKIDPEARFNDGQPISTDDFFMTFYMMQSPHIQDPWYNDFYDKKEFNGVTRYDEKTFAIRLAQPRPDPLWYISDLQPSPRHFFKEFGKDFPERYQWKKAPGTGAYHIYPEGMVKGRSVTLTRVKDWWAKDRKHYRYRYNFDFIDYKIIGSPDKAFELFRQGQLDIFYFSYLNLPRFWHDKLDIPEFHNGYIEKAQFYNDYPRITRSIWMNCDKPGLDNKDVRKGIQHAMNIQKVIDVDFRGDVERMQTCVPGYGKFTPTTIKARPFDPAKAREYFKTAGYTKTGPDGILLNEAGKRLSFTISNPNPATERALLRLKQEAVPAGLELIIETGDMEQVFAKSHEKQHEMIIMGFGAAPPYPRFWEHFHSVNAWKMEDGKRKLVVNTNNITQTVNPEMDKIIDQHRAAQTEDEIQRLSWQLAEMVHEEACVVPCWETPYYRSAHWRWLRWPADFNVKMSREPREYAVDWLDEEVRAETMKAREEKRALPETELIFEQYRAK